MAPLFHWLLVLILGRKLNGTTWRLLLRVLETGWRAGGQEEVKCKATSLVGPKGNGPSTFRISRRTSLLLFILGIWWLRVHSPVHLLLHEILYCRSLVVITIIIVFMSVCLRRRRRRRWTKDRPYVLLLVAIRHFLWALSTEQLGLGLDQKTDDRGSKRDQPSNYCCRNTVHVNGIT